MISELKERDIRNAHEVAFLFILQSNLSHCHLHDLALTVLPQNLMPPERLGGGTSCFQLVSEPEILEPFQDQQETSSLSIS